MKNHPFKNVLSITTLFLVLSSCAQKKDHCNKIGLSKDELGWFSNYKEENGDTIYYSSIGHETDTFVVNAKNILSYTLCNNFELGSYVYQVGSISFDNLDSYQVSTFRKKYYLGFNKIGQDSTMLDCKKRIRFFDLSTDEFQDFSKIPTQEFTIPENGQKIEVYVYTKNVNCRNPEGITDIMQEFAVSKQYGLIWYKTTAGETFNRIW